ncbi:Nucleobase-ascorbate transporter 7 [Triticum urartu]|uniref:Nucleobase-ascorbate transporter 7 n=1 Tax=Triticum urartu TaxID=4572 RepID=M8A7R5_TRIUA|nr:Nucleobase-ascorbate transporter 7 [Triticum urartu]
MATFGEQQNEQGHAAVAAKRRMAQPTKKARKPEFLGEPVPADEACANWPQRYQCASPMRITVPYPFQWGAPTFHAAECFAMMAAAFVALVELNKCKMHDEIFCRVLLRTAISRKDGKLKQIAKDGEVERLKVESPDPQRHQRFVVDLIRDRPRGRPWRSGCWLARAFGADADDDAAG